MDLELFKQAYRTLSTEDRKALATWIFEQQMQPDGEASSDPSGNRALKGAAASATPPVAVGRSTVLDQAGPAAERTFPWIAVMIGVLVVAVLGGIGFSVWSGMQADQARRTAEQIEEAERMRSGSPTNLAFLEENRGKVVTVRGIPAVADVGYLFFARNRKQGLRLNLWQRGVVVVESTKLRELVDQKKTVQVTGQVVWNQEDGIFEIRVVQDRDLRVLD